MFVWVFWVVCYIQIFHVYVVPSILPTVDVCVCKSSHTFLQVDLKMYFLKYDHCSSHVWIFCGLDSTTVSQMKTLNILKFLSWTICCADPWLISRCAAISFTVTRRFSFTMASTAAVASSVTPWCAWPGRGESVSELMAFMNFLVHMYTCCSDRHASPYWTFSSMNFDGFHPFTIKNGWQNAVLLWCMLQAGPPSLHYYSAIVFHSCIVLPPVGHTSEHKYHCCQLTRQSSCVSNFYRTFKVFIWLSFVYQMRPWLVHSTELSSCMSLTNSFAAVRDIRPLLRSRWDLFSSGILHSI